LATAVTLLNSLGIDIPRKLDKADLRINRQVEPVFGAPWI
jgi:hypothetical protein